MRSATQTAPRPIHQLVRRVLGLTLPPRLLMVEGSRQAGAVCLTFDDGPDPSGTAHVLDILASEHVSATFFLQGDRAVAHESLVRRIRNEGHAIGHHSWSHSTPSRTSAAQLAEEAERTRRWLKWAVDVDATLFRPPHGRLTAAKALRLWAMRQTLVLWNVDPGDVFQPNAAAIVTWFERHPPFSGDIVLLHDRCAALADALPALIATIHSRGLEFATIPDWVNTRRATPRTARRGAV